MPATGIYTATHYQHRLPHEVFALAGEQFPECRRCGSRAVFTLLKAVPDIDADQDFARSAESRKPKKAGASTTDD
ncbi:MAG TPA: hypothetical protein VFY05_08215 [Candidatus Angelobacter sp.]|nr:hypothetical protein [Candidatus Angelobacter sp.]